MSDFPASMCEGSEGPHVSILHAYLCGMGRGHQLQFDGEYGEVTSKIIRRHLHNLSIVSGKDLDCKAQRVLKDAFNFDFEAICKTVPGTTQFVQPDGSVIVWTSPAVCPDQKDDETRTDKHGFRY